LLAEYDRVTGAMADGNRKAVLPPASAANGGSTISIDHDAS